MTEDRRAELVDRMVRAYGGREAMRAQFQKMPLGQLETRATLADQAEAERIARRNRLGAISPDGKKPPVEPAT